MEIFFIILFIISIICLIISFKKYELNKDIENENRKQEEFNKLLQHKEDVLQTRIKGLEELAQLEKDKFQELRDSQTQRLQESAAVYIEFLDKSYQEKEEEYDRLIQYLCKQYDLKQDELNEQLVLVRKDLDKISSTRAAALEAQRKEKEIKDNKNFYSLSITENDLDDVKALDRVKKNLHQPRILSMLIWSTYFQKPMTTLCNNILGLNTVTGIYKITNQTNDMCYIGQSVDISKRWKDHAKCGLDIDRPQGNKLYQAMIEDGIWNFSWELLEACPRAELNEKEKFYIDLYQSKEYGYNSTKGVN